MQRPARFQINRNHPLTNGLKFAWLGYLPGGNRSFSSDPYNAVGTKSGDVYWAYSPELRRSCQVFDGTGDYVTVSQDLGRLSFIQNTHTFGISFFVKLDTLTRIDAILGNISTAFERGFNIHFRGDTTDLLRLDVGDGTGTTISGTSSTNSVIADANWHHVIVNGYRSGTTNVGQIIVDGVDVTASNLGRTPLSSGNCTYPLLIGARNSSSPTYPMDGQLCDVMIRDRPYTLNEAKLLASRDPMIGGLIEPIGGLIYPYVPDQIASYTLTAGSGSFSLSGQMATLQSSRILPAEVGTLSLAGNDANFGTTLPAGSGNYTLLGQDINFTKSLIIPAASGSFSLSGQSAALMKSLLLAAGSGSYSLSGGDVNFIKCLIVPAASGAFSLSGADADFIKQLILPASYGSLSLTGQAADLLISRLLAAGNGEFSLSGQNAALLQSRLIGAGNGSFELSGQDINFLKSLIIPAGNGAFTLTGSDIDFIKQLILPASSGAFTLAGTAASLLISRLLAAGSGEFTLSGTATSLLESRLLAAASGSFSLSGQDATLLTSRVILAENGAFVLSGSDATLVFTPFGSYILVAGSGSFSLSGTDASLLASRIIPVESGAFSLIGQDASLLKSLRLVAGTGTFSLNGQEVQLVYTPIGNFYVFRGRIIGMVGSGGGKSRQIGGN